MKEQNKITVFSTPTCPWCHKVKEYLSENKFEYTDINVAFDRESAIQMVSRSGEMGVPQLWINGRVVVGFNKPLIDELLGIH